MSRSALSTGTSIYERYGVLITVLGCLLLPCVAFCAVRSMQTNSNEVTDWLPADYAETVEYQWFQKHFANDEFVLVTWEGCTVDDARLDRLADALRSVDPAPEGAPPERFPRVITGRSTLDDLLTSFTNLTREEAIEQLRGSLVGPDGRQTCAIVSLTDTARRKVHNTLALLRQAVAKCDVPADDVRMGGSLILNAAIDKVSGRSLNQVVLISCFAVTFIAWLSIRNIRLIIVILVTGLYSAGLSLTVLWLSGHSMNAVLVTMIPMVYTAATSGSIHLCNYYLESVHEGGVRGAAGRAVAHAWVPLGLATATTAAGLLSICYTDLILIQQFGIFSAIGVSLSWVLLVAWLPAVLTVWRPRNAEKLAAEKVDSVSEETGEAPLNAFWDRLGRVVTGRPLLFSGLCFLVFGICVPGLMQLEVSIDLLKEFKSDAEIIKTYTWLEEKLGPLMPQEVVIRMDENCPLTIVQRVRLIERLQKRFQNVPDTGYSLSAATYVPDTTQGPGPAWLRRGVLITRLNNQRDRLRNTGYLTEDDGEELWRITVRVAALREVNYVELVNALRSEVDQELADLPEDSRQGITATYTGVSQVFFKARQSLVDGLYWGIVTDLVLIVVTVIVTMRHWANGLLMMFISLFPTFIVLGTAGWMGWRIDLGAVMAPCVALGVTVDDVIHFLLWFRWGTQRGLSRQDSVLLAWRACVRPMYQSWALLGLGMSCLLISQFLPILQFGAIMTAMLTAGLLGNLFFLPSLLAGPLGGIIARRCPPSPAPAAEPAVDENVAAMSSAV